MVDLGGRTYLASWKAVPSKHPAPYPYYPAADALPNTGSVPNLVKESFRIKYVIYCICFLCNMFLYYTICSCLTIDTVVSIIPNVTAV